MYYVPARNFEKANYATIVFKSHAAYANAVVATSGDTVAVLPPREID